jgi:hypothetical protein
MYVAVGTKIVYGHCSCMFVGSASLLVMEVSLNNKTALSHCVIIRPKRENLLSIPGSWKSDASSKFWERSSVKDAIFSCADSRTR